MRRPANSSVQPAYRAFFLPAGNAQDDQREGPLARRVSIRERNRRVFNDNFIFNPLRRPRDRLYQELAERHRAAARLLATLTETDCSEGRGVDDTEPKLRREEKPIECTIVETDGGSYQSSTGVTNVCNDDNAVYCSYKRNNVNILFEHAHSTPFELTRIVVKTPSVGYSSPAREGLVYISMSPIQFKDTECYDRPEYDENTSQVFDNFGINCLEGRRAPAAAPLAGPKNGKSSNAAPPPGTNTPSIPPWGTADSGKRKETEPVASFRVARTSNSTDIVFEPPITGRFILVKLFNNMAGEQFDKYAIHRQTLPGRRAVEPRPVLLPNLLRDDPSPSSEPRQFDVIEDELEEAESLFGDPHGGEEDFENVDVQAILFYGYTGRRRFPIIKAL